MKQFKLTFVLTVLMSMVGLQAFAKFDTSTKVQVGGLYYYLDKANNQAQVTYMPSGYYTGAIEITPNIEYGGKTYSVTSIGAAFSGCSGLTSVTIPNSVTSIGYYAFEKCSGLTSVTIPNSVTSIGDYAFLKCSGLTSVTIPNSVTSIGDYAFQNCSNLTSVTLNSNAIASKTYTNSNNIKNIFGEQVTEYIIGDDVTSIGEWAFYSCSKLTSVTIGKRVSSISENAFYKCSGLTSVTLNSNAIASKAYTSYMGITDNIKNIFGGQVKEYIIGKDVTSIGDYAFFECSGLTSVTIGKSVKSIGSWAFYRCSGLTSVEIPNSVTSIGGGAFDGCSGLTSVTIPNSVTSIGNSAFENCSGLTSVTIGNSVKSIGNYAFRGCSGLTSVTIPNSVTSIGYDAFGDCSGLKKVIVKDIAAWCKISFVSSANPLYYAKHLYSDENTEITDLVIPDGVTSIGNYAFDYCSGLTSVTIPNSVTSIGERVFYGCSGLTSVTIPNSVTSIGSWAFSSCSKLTSVTAFNPTPVNIMVYTFSNRANATLYVPKGSKDAYKAADYWKEFKEIVEMETTGIDQISFQENGNGEQVIDQEGAVWYTIDGKQIDKPKKGINIIRMSDGTTRKVVVK